MGDYLIEQQFCCVKKNAVHYSVCLQEENTLSDLFRKTFILNSPGAYYTQHSIIQVEGIVQLVL